MSQKNPLMPMDKFNAAANLLDERHRELNRLAIARTPEGVGELTLGITLGGRYQNAEFVDQVRPVVCNLIIDSIYKIDVRLRELGVEPNPIPQSPWSTLTNGNGDEACGKEALL